MCPGYPGGGGGDSGPSPAPAIHLPSIAAAAVFVALCLLVPGGPCARLLCAMPRASSDARGGTALEGSDARRRKGKDKRRERWERWGKANARHVRMMEAAREKRMNK